VRLTRGNWRRKLSGRPDWQNAMIAWEGMPTEKANMDKPTEPVATSLLYRLTVAFPSWAGALFVLYSVFIWKFGGLRIRPR